MKGRFRRPIKASRTSAMSATPLVRRFGCLHDSQFILKVSVDLVQSGDCLPVKDCSRCIAGQVNRGDRSPSRANRRNLFSGRATSCGSVLPLILGKGYGQQYSRISRSNCARKEDGLLQPRSYAAFRGSKFPARWTTGLQWVRLLVYPFSFVATGKPCRRTSFVQKDQWRMVRDQRDPC